MSDFTPSPYQQAIFSYLESRDGSAVVEAVAGSGKTTAILQGLTHLRPTDSCQLLAFNKSIADELKIRIDALNYQLLAEDRFFPSVISSTFHSAAFGAVRNHLAPLKLTVDPHKTRQICKTWLSKEDQELYASYICRLVSLAKGAGLGALYPNSVGAWTELVEHHDLMLDSDEADEGTAINLAQGLLEESTKQATKTGLLDFDDQLYLTCLWDLKLQPKDWIFVDEAQDTNAVRRAIVEKIASAGGRVVAVGDRHQSIYGFTGASVDAMDLIQETFDARLLPLSICYRCAKAVVKHAQSLVPALEPSESAQEGLVSSLGVQDVSKTFGPSDAILCRNTAPLVSAAYKLLSLDVPCTILGRDLGQGLISLVLRFKSPTLEILEGQLEAYRQREVTKFRAREQHAKAEAINDRIDCIRLIIDHLPEGQHTVDGLCGKIRSLFTEGGQVLTLSTMHKAKGREWPTVGILRPDLVPSRWATQEWQQQQERNLQYVAWTRAKERLFFLQGDLK